MKKSIYKTIVAFILISLMNSCGYNSMVSKSQAVNAQWANVQSAYQRRADLIPNLVSTVKGEANFEQSTLTAVADARARATSMQIDPSKVTPDQLMQYQQAQGQLGMALGRLLSVTENYPNLQANQAFRELSAELAGTENRINVERNRFNEVVGDYNTYIKSIPQSFFAGSFGFTEKAFFQADPASSVAPKVNFESK
jgi:LemA protein